MARRVALLVISLFVCRSVAQLPVAAKAGLLYFYDGDARIDGQRLSGGATLDRVLQGQILEVRSGNIEMLLQPGNLIRAAQGASLTMVSDSLTATRIRIDGTAILDLGVKKPRKALVVSCRGVDIDGFIPGVYRLECRDGGPAILKVFEGKFEHAKAGEQVELGDKAKPRRFDRSQRDAFDLWSASRAVLAGRLRERDNMIPPGQGATYKDPNIFRSLETLPPPQ